MRKKNNINYPKSAAMGVFSKGLKIEFETSKVNEPSVFEPVRFYCIFLFLDENIKCESSLEPSWHNFFHKLPLIYPCFPFLSGTLLLLTNREHLITSLYRSLSVYPTISDLTIFYGLRGQIYD